MLTPRETNAAARLQPKRPRSLQSLAVLVLVAVLLAAGIWVWRQPPTPVPRLTVAIVLDASPTAEQDRRCADALRIGAQILAQAKGTIRLTVYATGDRSTGGEPIRLGVVIGLSSMTKAASSTPARS